MVQVFSEKRHLRRDGQEILGYNQIAPSSPIVVGTGGAPGTPTGPHPDLANVWYPTLVGSALFEQERRRERVRGPVGLVAGYTSSKSR